MAIAFDEQVNYWTLLWAWERFRSGKRRRYDIAEFDWNLEGSLLELADDLARGRYRHGPYETFVLCDSKRRRIDKATVRDRVVHELVFRLLEVEFNRSFIFDSYSSRRGKGTQNALKRTWAFLAPWRAGQGGWYAVIGDVRSYFAEVSHAVLVDCIHRRITDPRFLRLVDEIIGSFHTDGRPGRGIPLGNITSQVFANIVLHDFDLAAKHDLHLKRYIRYNDDVLAIVRQEDAARTVATLVGEANRIGLDIGFSVVRLTPHAQFDWLGVRHGRFTRMIRPKTQRRIRLAFKRTLRRLKHRTRSSNDFRRIVGSYRAYVSSVEKTSYDPQDRRTTRAGGSTTAGQSR